jgi:hypothetical protein
MYRVAPVAQARLLRCALLALALGGCRADDALRRFTPAEADTRARGYLALFAAHRGAEAETRLLPGMSGSEAHTAYVAIDSLLGGQHFDSVRVIGSAVNTINGVRHTNLTYEFKSQSGWILANVATVDSAGTWFVEALHARPMPQPLEVTNTFTLGGGSPLHYAWLILTIACAVVSLGTAIWLATRRQMPKRWRWVFLALLGVGGFSLNWTTGETAFRIVNVQLFGAGAMRLGPAAPWILTFGLPVGAILSLMRYRRWLRTPGDAPAASSTLTVM